MSAKTPYPSSPLSLPSTQWQWLEKMTSDHKLSDISKAIRCCVTCVALGDAQMTINGDGDSKSAAVTTTNAAVVEKDVQLSKEQFQWLKNSQQSQSMSQTLQNVVQACMATTTSEYTVFGIIRCKSSIAKCNGAQEAVQNIISNFGAKNEQEALKCSSSKNEGGECCKHAVNFDGVMVKENIKFNNP